MVLAGETWYAEFVARFGVDGPEDAMAEAEGMGSGFWSR